MSPEFQAAAQRLSELLSQGSAELAGYLQEQHPADVAEWLEELPPERRVTVLRLLGTEQAALVLGELDLDTQAELVQALGQEATGDILEEMSDDEAADLLGELSPEHAGRLLGEMGAEDAADVRELLTYESDTAGGLMTTDYVAVKANWTAEKTIVELRRLAPDAETAYYVYAVDEVGVLVGVLSLRELIVAPPATPISTIMRSRMVKVLASDDQEEVARTVSKYNLMAVPVVDESGVLLGIITADDVIDVLEEEATEDIYRFASSSAAEAKAGPLAGIWLAVRSRLPWLVMLLFLEMIAGTVVEQYAELLKTMTVLAFFIPVMAGEAGNAATQSIAVVVRGLATGDIVPSEAIRVVWRELRVGTVVGLACGVTLFAAAWIWQGDVQVAAITGIALTLVLPVAKLLGALFPMLIHRIGLDPAVASGPFITTLTDVLSMLTYFGVATWVVGGLN